MIHFNDFFRKCFIRKSFPYHELEHSQKSHEYSKHHIVVVVQSSEEALDDNKRFFSHVVERLYQIYLMKRH